MSTLALMPPANGSVAVEPVQAEFETQDFVLARLGEAKRALLAAQTPEEVKELIDVAATMQVYARRVAASFDTMNYAAEVKVRAERRLGEILQGLPKNRGLVLNGSSLGTHVTVAPSEAPKLSDLGISHNQSSRSQKLASLGSDVFEFTLQRCREQRVQITAGAFLAKVKTLPKQPKMAAKATLEVLVERTERMLCELYAQVNPGADQFKWMLAVDELKKALLADFIKNNPAVLAAMQQGGAR